MIWIHRCLPPLVLLTVAFGSGCHKKPEKQKSSKRQHEEVLIRANDEQVALDKFVDSVREVFLWHQAQPVASEAGRHQSVKELSEKMAHVPTDGLPQDLSDAWKFMLDAWRALAKTTEPAAALRDEGAKAAQELNRRLSAHGVTGILF